MAGKVGSRRKSVPNFEMGPEHRLKIANSNVLKCLIQHAEGTREMSATQVTAGIALLRKVLPDLAAAEINHSGNVTFEQIERVIVPGKANGHAVEDAVNTKH